MALMCKIGLNANILLEQCALTHMTLGNDQSVHLLEHLS